MNRLVAFILLIAVVVLAQAQQTDTTHTNLVYNGSFEEYRSCPKRIDAVGVLSIVDCWYQPTKGSADYFNKCGSHIVCLCLFLQIYAYFVISTTL